MAVKRLWLATSLLIIFSLLLKISLIWRLFKGAIFFESSVWQAFWPLSSRVLGSSPSRDQALWFVDSAAHPVSDLQDASLSGIRLAYDTGPNDGNPYRVSHRAMDSSGSAGTVTWEDYNRYNERNLTPPVAPSFPAQSILACNNYGNYSYSVQDGCGRVTDKPSHQYGGPGGTCGGNNTRYCPPFDAVGPLGDCATKNLEACSNLEYVAAQGLCGKRPPNTCTFYPDLNRSCKLKSCPVPAAYRHLVGGKTSIEHGEQIGSCAASSPPSCGIPCSCDIVTCNDGVLPTPTGVVAYGGCSAWACPPPTCESLGRISCASSAEPGCDDTSGAATFCKDPTTPTPPPDEDCIGAWGACSADCGGGTQTFSISREATGTGAACEAVDGATQACNTQACDEVIHCVGAWGACMGGCGIGERTYSISTPAQNGGNACPFTAGEKESCSLPACTPWTVTQPAACPVLCGEPAQTLYGAVTCPGNCDEGNKPSTPERTCLATVACMWTQIEPEMPSACSKVPVGPLTGICEPRGVGKKQCLSLSDVNSCAVCMLYHCQ